MTIKKMLVFILVISSLFPIWAHNFVKIDIVDDFGDPIGKSYITYSEDMPGTYTNSYGKGNLLWNIRVYLSSGKAVFILKEEGKDMEVSTSSGSSFVVDSSTEYIITFKLADGKTKSKGGKLIKSDTYQMNNIEACDINYGFWGNYTSDWDCLDFFTSNNLLKVVIKSDYGSYSLGSMDLSDFENAAFNDELYSQGKQLMESGRYQDALIIFEKYKLEDEPSYNHFGVEALAEDCTFELQRIKYNEALKLMENGNYSGAIEKFSACEDYDNAKELIHECKRKISMITGIYSLGGLGPAGGYIFYDCDADNDSGNADGLISSECGWRYLEAAREDLIEKYAFGYYPLSDGSFDIVGTKTEVGTGKSNTDVLVKAMGSETCTSIHFGKVIKGKYAAVACVDYSITIDGVVYDDWFLPSKDELNLIYKNLKRQSKGSLADSAYWSSSESSGSYAWLQYFDDGYQSSVYRYIDFYVRPIRAF